MLKNKNIWDSRKPFKHYLFLIKKEKKSVVISTLIYGTIFMVWLLFFPCIGFPM